MKKTLSAVIGVFLFLFFCAKSADALSFDLIGPTEELIRGEEVQFTINIDTEGESRQSTLIGMTYETQYLEYVSVAPGNTFTTISADVQEGGKIVFTGSSESGFSGSGTYAVVTFNLIATEAGSTQLCALYNPGTTPTPAPTSTPGPNTPIPTALPTSGVTDKTTRNIALGILFVGLSSVGFFVFKKI